jgi:branched-chain amino acid transport system permease protein
MNSDRNVAKPAEAAGFIKKRRQLLKPLVLVLVGVVCIILPLIVKNMFFIHVMIMIFLYGALGEAWNIIGGYAGQVSLGQSMFFGVGAYSAVMCFNLFRLTPWIGGLIIGGIFAVLLAILIGIPSFRLTGIFFTITTIALGETMRILFNNWKWIGASVGLELPVMGNSWIGMQFRSKIPYYYIALGFMAIAIVVTYLLDKSRIGYYLRSLKEDEEAARSLGINISKYKLIAISISAFLTAMGGAFYAQYLRYIDPNVVISSSISLKICLVATCGGVATITGPILGSALLISLAEYSRAFMGGSGRGIDLMVYGLLLMIIVVFKPGGIVRLNEKNPLSKRR